MSKRAAIARLRREWADKLKASGFDDLERTGDPDGALSNRGMLHPVENTDEAWRHLAERAESGLSWTRWAEAVLHSHEFESASQREVWALHAQGVSERDIATVLALPRDRVRSLLAATREQVKGAGKGTKGGKTRQWRNEKRRRLHRVESKIRGYSVDHLRETLAVTVLMLSRTS